ncbi:uncharacterized protein TOT_020001105 [Theileria orientalis strain Shintoku]|uniref:RRM domain-containing protein n=1 Tax=Theileria orientalis strain Shintoku TaxID=869250 RepID=J4C8F7_THEOR|nr:uncharacterized protein TOT_020001105 [Theileria orientalis strain Shintoku]BAM40708.1 uncharacterized protein TOT_020001105 [Theileria orientalis strain Shintoku]|eukprot:XP_009691009.1 uncharacterized protein TOT_020001105 [Theileria orientalis strain Shintoku]
MSTLWRKIQVPGSLNVYRFDKVYRQGPATLVKNINKLPLQERIQNSVQKVTFLEVSQNTGSIFGKTFGKSKQVKMVKQKGVVPESIKEGINKQVKKLPASLLRAKGCERGDESTVEGKKNKRKKKKPENKESTKENEQLKKMESVEESGKGRKGGKKDGKVYKLKFRNFEGTIQEFKKLLDSNAKELGEYKKVNMRPNKIVVSFSDKKILERYLRHYNNYEHGEQKLKVAEMDYYETVKTDYKHLRLYGIPEEYDEKAVEEGLKRRISIEFKISKRKEEYKLEFRTVAECVKANAILNNSRIPLLKKKQETLVKVHTEMALFGAATRNSTRVFVRNLPFGTPEEDILEYFRRYDKKVKVHRPSKAKGFAFVSFSSLERARKVINELNGRMFNKRKIQLSMSLPKQLYDPKKEGSKEDPAEGMGDEKMIDDGSTDEKMIDDGMASKEDLEDTIFVRNLDYGCTEAELSEYFSKFGEVESSKIVLNEDKKSKGTAFVRFKRKEDVKKILESEKLALLRDEQLSSEKPTLGIGFTLRGRRLKVDGALAKGRAKALKQHRDEEELRKYNEGKNMHLLMVGVPSEESPEYAKMTPEQREGLKEYLERKLEKIRQKNTYVNPKRLCIKNLPGNINSNDLREVILNHLKNVLDSTEYQKIRKMKNRGVVEVKLFKGDTYTKDDQGTKVKKKKPYAFVELVDHNIATKTQQLFSNNSTLYQPKTLQCEYTIDTRFEKEERTKEKKVKVKKKTYSRGKRQREKRRQQKALKPQ